MKIFELSEVQSTQELVDRFRLLLKTAITNPEEMQNLDVNSLNEDKNLMKLSK